MQSRRKPKNKEKKDLIYYQQKPQLTENLCYRKIKPLDTLQTFRITKVNSISYGIQYSEKANHKPNTENKLETLKFFTIVSLIIT